MRAAIVLTLVLAMTGCGPATTDKPDPAGVQQVEDVVNGLDSVVSSAEAESSND